jgi:hypothetical protein
MLASAMNFAIGFFGYPFDGQYQQLITIESDGVSFHHVYSSSLSLIIYLIQFNNTLAPYKT